MAAVSAQELSGGVSDVHSQAPRHSARLIHQDQQFHRHPFYIPNPQPLMPYQWPLSAPYVPYTGFPGLGYGMVMPSLGLPPYLDVSGYMLPHAQVHMLDHRRMMNPHLPPNISHQANRFHCQTAMPQNRVMVSSEVQTEPACHGSAQDSHAGSESGRGTGCESPVSASASFAENNSGACAEDTPVFTHNRVVSSNTINTTAVSALHKSEILLQAERVQIKCSETPSRLKMIRTSETELTCNDARDLLQCSVGSMHSEDVVLCSYRSLAIRKDKQGVDAGYLRKHCLPVCKVGMSPSCGACPKLNAWNVKKSFEADQCCELQRTCHLKKTKHNFKILRLPFDTQTYSQLEASIWSVESLVPYVPSILRSPKTPESHTAPVGRNQHTTESTKRHHREFRRYRSPYGPSTTFDTQTCRQLEASMWSVESLAPYVPSGDWMIGKGHLTPQKCPESDAVPLVRNPHTESTKRHASPHRPSTNYSQLEASVWSVESLMPYVPSILKTQKTPESHAVPEEKNQHTIESTKRQALHKCGSPYRPSTSWLADLGNVYYYSKLPALQKKLSGVCRSPVENPGPEGKQTGSPELSPLKQKTTRRKLRPSGRNECGGTAAVSCGCVSHYSIKTPRCSCKTDPKPSDSHSCRRHESAEVKTHHETRKMILGSHWMKPRERSDLCEDCRCLYCDDDDDDEDWSSWRWRGTTRAEKKMQIKTSGQRVHLKNRVKAH
ncbi:uncharacterized protein buc2l [Triplophysa dalaica]|uniref:uncharacterized protein buc2l n=1 Tax=Triplophysa dalaica TaxID=1582913 RepID=UPI0024DFA065|nr:uncharacterized protein buc2l [Triplophysa dalaica]